MSIEGFGITQVVWIRLCLDDLLFLQFYFFQLNFCIPNASRPKPEFLFLSEFRWWTPTASVSLTWFEVICFLTQFFFAEAFVSQSPSVLIAFTSYDGDWHSASRLTWCQPCFGIHWRDLIWAISWLTEVKNCSSNPRSLESHSNNRKWLHFGFGIHWRYLIWPISWLSLCDTTVFSNKLFFGLDPWFSVRSTLFEVNSSPSLGCASFNRSPRNFIL